MIRPPPLQLKFDNRFPEPLRTPICQPSKSKASFVAQLYKASWKNPVIALAGLNGLRYAFSCYNAFGDVIVDEEEGAIHLFSVSLALCAIYVITFFIQIYGIIGVSLQRLSLVRVYLYLTLFDLLLVTTAVVLKAVTYFTLGDELIHECITLAMEGRGWQKSLFRHHPWPGTVVPYPAKLAEQQCLFAWHQHSWNHIAAVLLFHLIPAMVYYLIVHTYYKQTVNPTHTACLLSRGGVASASVIGNGGGGGGGGGGGVQRGVRQGGYSRVGTDDDNETRMTTARLLAPVTPRQRRAAVVAPYAKRLTTDSTSKTGVQQQQTKRTSSFVSSGIVRSHRPPPLVPSPSPLGLDSWTPGAPSYNNYNRGGPSRVYAAFAAPVNSSEYDKFV
jgi:hypothetical protein